MISDLKEVGTSSRRVLCVDNSPEGQHTRVLVQPKCGQNAGLRLIFKGEGYFITVPIASHQPIKDTSVM